MLPRLSPAFSDGCIGRAPGLPVQSQNAFRIVEFAARSGREHILDEQGDTGKGNAPVQKSLHGDFIGRI